MRQKRYGMRQVVYAFATILSCSILGRASASEDLSNWAPSTTLVYLESRDGSRAFDELQSSGLIDALIESKPGRTILDRPEVLLARGGIAAFEIASGHNLSTTLRKLAGHHLAVAIGPNNPSEADAPLALFARIESIDLARNALHGLAKLSGNDSGPLPSQGTSKKVIELAPKLFLLLGKELLVIANQRPWAESIGELYRGDGQSCLSKNVSFQETRQSWRPSDLLHGFIDLTALRSLTPGPDLISDELWDNPIGHLLFGGIADALNQSAALAFGASFGKEGLEIALDVDVPKVLPYFFASEKRDGGRYEIPGLIASGSFHRHLGPWWEKGYERFGQQLAAGIAEFESTIALFFGGTPFAETLSRFNPQLEFLIVRQSYGNSKPPLTQLPGFALLAKLADSSEESVDSLKREFAVAFQTAVGVVNAERAQEAKPLLLVGSSQVDDVQIHSAQFLPAKKSEALSYEANFQPALAVVGETLVLSSSSETATEIARAILGKSRVALDSGIDDEIHIDAVALRKILDDNLETLVGNAILEDGKTDRKAREDIELIEGIIDLFKGGRLSLGRKDNRLKLSLELALESIIKADGR